ncbi:MAG: methionine--tRNA ligase subunit beta, partial [Saprospiraceae bacterium]|nr:methionine--tRNA ligase subunit beta [Saprospiraceae bacterium]
KLSTSTNWAVWVHEYCQEFAGQEDVLRYNMIRKMPEQSDSEFTWKGFQETNNNELVNNLANFVNRVLVLTHKYYEGQIPSVQVETSFKSGWGEVTQTGFYQTELEQIGRKLDECAAEIERFNFREALRVVMEISSAGNALLQFNEPWKTIKEDPESVKSVLNLGLQYVAALSVAVRPFLPFSADKLRTMLNLPALADQGEWAEVSEALKAGRPLAPAGHVIGQPEHLFSRIPDEVIDRQLAKLEANQPAVPAPSTQNYAPVKENIQYDDFAKMDIRTGTILTAEKLEKSKKLLKLSVDLGFETRTILSGIAEHYQPEEVVGKQVVVLANLAPRVMMGVESQGMILMAEDADGKLAFVAPNTPWPSGMGVR